MEENKFAKGLIAKRHEKAPDFVICSLSVKKSEFIEWLNQQSGDWVNLQVLRSKTDTSKLYSVIDTWKPKEETIPGNEIKTGKQDMPTMSKEKELETDSQLPF